MKMLILILTGVALSFPVMAENPMNLGKALPKQEVYSRLLIQTKTGKFHMQNMRLS